MGVGGPLRGSTHFTFHGGAPTFVSIFLIWLPYSDPVSGQPWDLSTFNVSLLSNFELVKRVQLWCTDTVVTMSPMASQITSLAIVYSIVYSAADQRKHQSFASMAFVQRIQRGPVNSPHKRPVTRKMFPFDDVIMLWKGLPQI